jgi:hypothetical protein
VSDRYRAGNSEELIQRVGADHAIQILILEPLFEEKNRTRRLIAQMMRLLDGEAIGTALPDLPGTGESMINVDALEFVDWLDAVQSVIEAVQPSVIASLRGGCLLDASVSPASRWRFAPETGVRVVRDLERMRLTSGTDESVYGGHRLRQSFVEHIRSAPLQPYPRCRTVRLDTDALQADLKVSGTPLWRRAEPGEDAALAKHLADDLALWSRTCAAS